MRAETREAAAAFLEDLEYSREILAGTKHSPSQIRRLSAILRRLLVEQDLARVAAPRIGRLLLATPDNEPIYHAEKNQPYGFFSSGGAQVFGLRIRAMRDERHVPIRKIENFDGERVLYLGLDKFLAQRVLCLNGLWISRHATVKYVANVASGVHSGAAASREDAAMAHIRRCVRLLRDGEDIRIWVDGAKLAVPIPTDFSYSPTSIDAVLFEVMSAAQFMIISPTVLELEKKVRVEMGLTTATS